MSIANEKPLNTSSHHSDHPLIGEILREDICWLAKQQTAKEIMSTSQDMPFRAMFPELGLIG